MHCYPDYYNEFQCIASKCRHNCCIGWEIDIDEDTLTRYENTNDEFSHRFSENISYEDVPHFILGENERCPFLNNKNLCDIICKYSHDYLCDICKEHPRFHNELPGRVESGLGLCCEEAARLILNKKEPVRLVYEKDIAESDEIIILRDKIIEMLQNRELGIEHRIEDVLKICCAECTDRTILDWCDILLSLERMDESWGTLLEQLKATYSDINYEEFDRYMADRIHEYEQFCVYIIYRHFANSPNLDDAKKRACFLSFAYAIVRALGAMIFTQTGSFDFESQVEIVRLFSSEIEYSDENIHELFDLS